MDLYKIFKNDIVLERGIMGIINCYNVAISIRYIYEHVLQMQRHVSSRIVEKLLSKYRYLVFNMPIIRFLFIEK